MVKAVRPESGLRVGRLLKAHGLKGAIKLELYTDEPKVRFVPGATFTLQVPSESPWFGKNLVLNELKWFNESPVAFFAGVDDRNAAESLIKAILWVDEEKDSRPIDPDAWYDHQLIGMSVIRDGITVGTIGRVDHFPAQDLLIVETGTGEVMVPFVKAIVTSVDSETKRITIDPPLGLFEEPPTGDEAS